MTATVGSAFILSSVSSEPGPTTWEKALWAGGQGGLHSFQPADMNEPTGCWVLGAGAGIDKGIKMTKPYISALTELRKTTASCLVLGRPGISYRGGVPEQICKAMPSEAIS